MRPFRASLKTLTPPTIGFLLALALLLISSHLNFSLADEGYLWYGAQQVLRGEIPLRDFQSYDPVRYYWTAGIFALLHDQGIVAVRIAEALFGALGAALANWLVFRGYRGPMLVPSALIAATLTIWLYPRHKLFDITACIILLALLTVFLEKPSRYRAFLLGLVTGLIAIVGRNHGLYGAVAGAVALAYVAWGEKKGDAPALYGSWLAGGFAGYLPMLIALASVPDLFDPFLESIEAYFRMGATNIPLPIPWPWKASFDGTPFTESLRQVMLGLLCLGLPLFGFLGIAWAGYRSRTNHVPPTPTLLACALLTIPYTQFFYSRADYPHLAQSIFPLLIGLCVLTVRTHKPKLIPLSVALLAVSVFMMLPRQPLYAASSSGHWQKQEIGTDMIAMPQSEALDVSRLQTLVARYAPGRLNFLSVPYTPGAYALFQRHSPMWDIYPIVQKSETQQTAEIKQLRAANINLAVVDTRALDQNPAQRFSENDPLIYQFLKTHLRRVYDSAFPVDWEIYTKDSGIQAANPRDAH